VRAKLHTIDGLDNSDISVETNNGNVILSGRVASQNQLDTAVSAVKTIKGVKSVDTSNLQTGADTNQ
jgi:hyperosmotically inducible protein